MAVRAPSTETRQTLIEAAGELFAEHGLAGVSVRDIVAKAGTTLSAVNYHFNSKLNLYHETIRYALQRHIKAEDTAALIRTAVADTPNEVAAFIHQLVLRFFHNYLAPENPQWYARLINRAVVDASDDVSATIADVLRPTDEALHEMLLRHAPHLTATEAHLWRICLTGQIHYFLMARGVIGRLTTYNEDGYTPEFIETSADFVARNMVTALGLPTPARAARPTRSDAAEGCLR